MQKGSLSNHILSVSATMVGVCMTVISVIQLAPANAVTPWADRLLAVDSLVFLASVFLSYWAMRHPLQGARPERYADRLFLLALALMAQVSLLIAFELL